MPSRMKAGFTLIELMLVLLIIGVLASIAIPYFTKFQARAKQAEVKSNLKALFTAQKAYRMERDSYSEFVKAIGFAPERGNRYAYILKSGSPWEARTTAVVDETGSATWTGYQPDVFAYPSAVPTPLPSVTPDVVTGPLGSFTAVASGNIDNDAIQDEWSISTFSRSAGVVSDATTSCAGGDSVAGEPCLDVDDV